MCANFQKRQNDSAVTESRSGVDLGWEIDGDFPGVLRGFCTSIVVVVT